MIENTDPDARLYRKGQGKEAKLCFMGHAVMENRNGLIGVPRMRGDDPTSAAISNRPGKCSPVSVRARGGNWVVGDVRGWAWREAKPTGGFNPAQTRIEVAIGSAG